MPLVSSGVEKGNLRELALERMKDLGTSCRDVRTREVGIVDIHTKVRPEEIELIRRDYVANGGWETFLSYEDPEKDILVFSSYPPLLLKTMCYNTFYTKTRLACLG